MFVNIWTLYCKEAHETYPSLRYVKERKTKLEDSLIIKNVSSPGNVNCAAAVATVTNENALSPLSRQVKRPAVRRPTVFTSLSLLRARRVPVRGRD